MNSTDKDSISEGTNSISDSKNLISESKNLVSNGKNSLSDKDFLNGSNSPTGRKKPKCLIIHGFGGGPHEVRPLADYLAGLGYLQAKNISPFSAMIQFLIFLRRTKPQLEKVTCPVLITQAEDDDTVRIKSVDYLETHLASVKKETRFFPEGGHLILLSPAAEQVMGCVGEFLWDQFESKV